MVAQGVNIKYTAVKDYVALMKKREKIFIRVHTESGEEAQVDFGYVGLTPPAGKERHGFSTPSGDLRHASFFFPA